MTTRLRVDAENPALGMGGITGTTVSGERDFGLDSRIPQGRIEIIFRLRQNNRLRVDYFEGNRRGSRAMDRTILFGDETLWRMTGLRAAWTGASSH